MSPSCPYCEHTSQFFFKTQDYNKKVNGNVFSYFKCLHCGLIFIDPIPQDLEKYYPAEYYNIPTSITEWKAKTLTEKYKVDLVKRFIPKGRILEIGAGLGGFAFWAKEEGFTVEAIEMDRGCCEFISNRLGIEVVHTCNIKNHLPDQKYDVITLWHVLEHLLSPWSLIEKLVSSLTPKGFLIMALPNAKALQFKLFRQYWVHIDAPRHLQFIPMQLLITQLRKLDCFLKFKSTADKGALLCNRCGWICSSKHAASSVLKQLPKLLDLALTKGATSLSVLFSLIERYPNLGSTYTLVFQKEKL